MEIDHLEVPVTSYETGKGFYERVLGPLGFSVQLDWPDRRRAYFGLGGAPSSLWVCESAHAGALALSLTAGDAHAVDRFHDAAVAAGAQTDHAPGIDAERSQNYYAARVVDPDGNSIEAVFRAEPGTAALAA